jgi:hypothetical protein
MLDNTIIVFTADNGGPTTTGDGVGARNWPMRGGKHSIWQGGVRVTGLISGAELASNSRGGTYNGLMHGADWLPTLAEAAGFELSLEGGLVHIDGISQWQAINDIENETTPRTQMVIGNSTNTCSWSDLFENSVGCGFSIVNDTGSHLWKLIRGYGGGPDTWCNTSQLGGNKCIVPPVNESSLYAKDQNSGIVTTPRKIDVVFNVDATNMCNIVKGACFPGHDLSSFYSNSTDGSDCCSKCTETQGCVGWTYNSKSNPHGPQCFLKKSIDDPRRSDSCISGNNGKTPLPPIPPAPSPAPFPSPGRGSCPGGWCLYDVRQDIIEQYEISASHADVVASMQHQMNRVLESYWQYSEDKNCPAHKFPDPNKPAWGPWC